ncbi:hypothetical protein SAMD00019534_099350 [Acytostelium subglobosum LB1]|uniref:hypothetical protein n=1 Tax=Acytostelium subglobosum LB1 TaxID=1410327 RepID=UPI000644DD4B|nr:hypothetical protein SAMD00019534_099350 [Acytostelium subglobosum LB1]GAM26760.1 hypothetical protein SAMD00019534_099350 [Acytostelium subglobosum LB1]|eukprot:XP_012750421.1 hypothetical protein SAMD00019534_099350 [Acytostelium subglobosum LB1]
MRQVPIGQFINYQTKHFWPFMVGAVFWAGLITKVHMGITDNDRKNSVYWQKIQRIQHPELFKDGHSHSAHH